MMNKKYNSKGGKLPVVTDNVFKERVYRQVGDEYTVLSPYVRSTSKVVFKHNKCGNTFEMTPNHFLKDKRRCSICSTKRFKSSKVFEKQFNKLANNEYILCTPYHKSHEKVVVLHKTCGTKYKVTPHDFLSGHRCPECFGKQKKTTLQFYNEVDTLTHGEYKLMSKYINSKTSVVLLHKICNNSYSVIPHDFLQGTRCPYCNESHGEKLLQYVLDDLNIDYTIQKVFDDCGTKNQWLPFDFYIPSYNLLLEYDGIQHFKPVKYFGGQSKLKDQKRRDKIKNDYALSKGINLLRIPYNLKDSYIEKKLKYYLDNCKAEEPKSKFGFMI